MDIETRRSRVRHGLKSELREIALELFERRGFEQVGFGHLAIAAGVPERMLFRYFDTKEDLLLGGFCRSAACFGAALLEVPRGAKLPEALRAALLAETGACLQPEDILVIARHKDASPHLRAALEERRHGWQREAAAAMAAWLGHAAGDCRTRFWAASMVDALSFAVQAQAGQSGAWLPDRENAVEQAFENLGFIAAYARRAGLASDPGPQRRRDVEAAAMAAD